MEKEVKTFIPFGKVDAFGDMISSDCKVTFAPGIKILESHRDENGLRIITKVELGEVSQLGGDKIFSVQMDCDQFQRGMHEAYLNMSKQETPPPKGKKEVKEREVKK